MKIGEIRKLVAGTADAAFALDTNGLIVAWNKSAIELFGIAEKSALGKSCNEILHGVDECGRSCGDDCTILQQARNHQPLKSYDIQINANGKSQWCNISVLIVEENSSTSPFTVHIARPADLRKRFELLMRDFVVKETSLPTVNVDEILTAKSTPTNFTELTKREIEILRFLAKGSTTKKISEKLFISPTTVNNHVQHIMQKLNAHSRLEAVRRAEQARLL
jgi:PAS domain S-box-containing protein